MAKEQRDIPKEKITSQGLKKSIQLFHLVDNKNKWLFVLGTICLGFTAVTLILFPKLLGELVDTQVGKTPAVKSGIQVYQVKKVAYGFLYLFAAQALFSFIRISLYVKVTENLIFAIRNKLFSNSIMQPMQFFYSQRIGDLLSRFSADIGQIQDAFTTNIAMFIRQILNIFGGIVYIFIVSPKLALYMLITVPIVVVISLFFGKYIRKVSKKLQDSVAQNTILVEESFAGILNVKAFSNEFFEQAKFKENANNLKKESIYRGLLRGAFSSFIILCLFGSIVFLIFLGLNFVQNGTLKIGELIQFMLLTGFVGGGIGGLAESYIQIQKTIGAVDRVMELIALEPEKLELNALPYAFKKEIAFKNVHFYYPTRPETEVIQNISFNIKKGETFALVGASGAGKSTIIQLIYALVQPSNGEIIVDQNQLNTISLSSWRKTLALVPQEVTLFGGTILENIQYGFPQATKEQIMQAAKNAYVDEFVQNFPQKYETLVGDRGIKLSGGQRQRVAIARAFLANPQILILDEATSSLDTESEMYIQKAMDSLLKNRTAIIIAHRLSTIQMANTIVVLNQGKVVEQGNHQQLYNKNGTYTQMVDKQQLNTV